MTTITITLPDELAKQAKAKGLLSSEAIQAYLRDRLQENGGPEKGDASRMKGTFDPRREGLVNPAVFRKGEILGDIVCPFHEEWGETP